MYLNTTEIWTLVNKTLIAHPFHIHDIQFNVIEKSGLPPSPSEDGWKDVILVLPNDSVKFITKFETFADNITPYMYHCHLLHHEDDGMMGSFLVVDSTATGVTDINFEDNFTIYPNPTSDFLNIISPDNKLFALTIYNAIGEIIYTVQAASNYRLSTINFPNGLYFIHMRTEDKFFTKKIIKQ